MRPRLSVASSNRAAPQQLNSDAVQPLLLEALARWQAAGFDTSGLGAIDVRIAEAVLREEEGIGASRHRGVE